jgi:hypothetical protein
MRPKKEIISVYKETKCNFIFDVNIENRPSLQGLATTTPRLRAQRAINNFNSQIPDCNSARTRLSLEFAMWDWRFLITETSALARPRS